MSDSQVLLEHMKKGNIVCASLVKEMFGFDNYNDLILILRKKNGIKFTAYRKRNKHGQNEFHHKIKQIPADDLNMEKYKHIAYRAWI